MATFLQHLTNALSVEACTRSSPSATPWFLGVLRLINFAHGEIFMMGMYFAFFGISLFMMPWYVTFLLTVALTGLLGVGAERLAYRPLRSAPRISVLISAIGVSYFLQNLATVAFGGRPMTFPQIPLFTSVMQLGTVRLQRLALLVPVIAGGLMVLLMFLIKKTKTGMAMRAVARDYDAASLMGIDLNKTIAITFFIGSALAGAGHQVGHEISPDQPHGGGHARHRALHRGGAGASAIPPGGAGGLLLGGGDLLVAAWRSFLRYRTPLFLCC